MAIGTVNVGGSGGLPLNVRFQMVEPVEKTGLWVKKDLTKAPPIYVDNYTLHQATGVIGMANMSNDVNNATVLTVEADDYYVFYGAESNDRGLNDIFTMNKVSGVIEQQRWMERGDYTNRPLAVGNNFYNLVNKSFNCHNLNDQTIETITLDYTSFQANQKLLFRHANNIYIMAEDFGGSVHVFRYNLINKEMTDLGNYRINKPSRGIVQIGKYIYYFRVLLGNYVELIWRQWIQV